MKTLNIVVLSLGWVASATFACNVPVFRYALERWPADNFTVELLHRGPVPETNVVAALQKAADRAVANFTLTVTNVLDSTNLPLPWMTVQFPEADQLEKPAWSGPFAAETGRLLLDSPARRELVRRIVSGDSVVWVLLDGDAAAAKLLDTELRKLQKEITVPEVDPNDPRTAGNTNLTIAFSVLPVSRADAAEKFFVSMLLNSTPITNNTTGPVAFPVFGRGRVLTGFSGQALNAENITDASQYMCGACSCEIKEQNPGVDLLLAVNWEEAIEKRVVQDPPLPPLVSLSTLAAAAQPVTPVAPATHGELSRNLIISLGVLVVVIIAGTVIAKRKA